MPVVPPSSFFVALRDSPYAPRTITAPATGYNSCLLLAPTARTVATLYQLGCDLESRDWNAYDWNSRNVTAFCCCMASAATRRAINIIDILAMNTSRAIINELLPRAVDDVLPLLMRLGAVWRDHMGDIIRSSSDLMSLVIHLRCSGVVGELLLTGGVDIPPTSAMWDRWLHASISDFNCLRLLLEYGGNPNARDESGKSLLQVLALQYQPNEEIFKLLLQHGADPNEQLCAAEGPTWTYSAILQHEQAERKPRRPIESGKSASAARFGFAYRHDDGQDADDNTDIAENRIPAIKKKA